MNEIEISEQGFRERLYSVLLILVILVMIVVVVIATGFSLVLYRMAGVWMYDSNFDTFENVLDPQQGEAIIWSARSLMWPAIAALVVTNLCWIVATVLSCLLRKGSNSG